MQSSQDRRKHALTRASCRRRLLMGTPKLPNAMMAPATAAAPSAALPMLRCEPAWPRSNWRDQRRIVGSAGLRVCDWLPPIWYKEVVDALTVALPVCCCGIDSAELVKSLWE